MSRLIDADKLHDCIMDNDIHNGIMDVKNVFEFIEKEPSIDAVPVVRCRDCKYRTWFAPYYGCGNFESPFYRAVDRDIPIMTKPDDFCSYGERKEDAE